MLAWNVSVSDPTQRECSTIPPLLSYHAHSGRDKLVDVFTVCGNRAKEIRVRVVRAEGFEEFLVLNVYEWPCVKW